MTTRPPSPSWESVAEAAFLGIRSWRAAHPKATLMEIEAETNQQLARLYGRIVQDVIDTSAVVDFRRAAERPPCPHCGRALQAMGQQPRKLTTQHEQQLVVNRTRGQCPGCGAGVSPPG